MRTLTADEQAAVEKRILFCTRRLMRWANVARVATELVPVDRLESPIEFVNPTRFVRSRGWVSAVYSGNLNAVTSVEVNGVLKLGVIAEETSSGIMILNGVHRALAAVELGWNELLVHVIYCDPMERPPVDRLTSLPTIEVREARLDEPARKFGGVKPLNFRPGELLNRIIERGV